MKTSTIHLNNDSLAELNRLLSGEDKADDKDGNTLFLLTFPFEPYDDDIFADIKLVASGPDSTPYVDAVLFQRGIDGCLHEVLTLEPAFDTYNGEYRFEYEGETYVAIVKDSTELLKQDPKAKRGLTYRKLRDMLSQIPEEHIDDDVTVLVNDNDDYECCQMTDFVAKWPDPQHNEEEMPVGDYNAMLVDQVEGVLDDDHPYFTLIR